MKLFLSISAAKMSTKYLASNQIIFITSFIRSQNFI